MNGPVGDDWDFGHLSRFLSLALLDTLTSSFTPLITLFYSLAMTHFRAASIPLFTQQRRYIRLHLSYPFLLSPNLFPSFYSFTHTRSPFSKLI